MKKIVCIIFVMAMVVAMFAGCGDAGSTTSKPSTETTPAPSTAPAPSTTTTNSNSDYNKTSTSSFTNKYGTATTKCAHSGCSNYIASSGDTNCCTTHSNKCLNCKKYIDEDAMYCMSCLSNSASKNSNSYSSQTPKPSSSNTAGGSGKCKYKVGGSYVCSSKATNGSYCKTHFDYLNDAYNSLFGD